MMLLDQSEMIAIWTKLFPNNPKWPGEREALTTALLTLEIVMPESEHASRNMNTMHQWLLRAKELINSAYACPEWLRQCRSERTDETERIIRAYLEEFNYGDH